MIDIVRRLFSKTHDSALTLLVSGTIVAQAISLAASPVITRLFSPEVIGELTVYSSIVGILSVIVCLRFDISIVIPKNKDEGDALFKISIFFALLFSIICAVILSTLNTTPVVLSVVGKYWYLLPVMLFQAGILQATTYLLTRNHKYITISWNKIIASLCLNAVSIIWGYAGGRNLEPRLWAIIIANTVSIIFLWSSIKDAFFSKYEDYFGLVKEYKNVLKYDVWGALLNSVSWMLVPIVMKIIYSANVAGQYSISMRIIQLPASVLGVSLSQVFLAAASEKRNEASLYAYTLATTKKLLKYTAPVAMFIALLGPDGFALLFGERWRLSGRYTQILTPWAILWFCASPIHGIFTILKKQSYYLVVSAIILATRVISLYIGKLFSSDLIGLAMFSGTGFIVYGISLIICLKLARFSDLERNSNPGRQDN